MGIIKPPWISQKWFRSCPFNYCDHFGDKKLLATVCIICKEDIERIEKYQKESKDPYDMKNILDDVAQNFAKTMTFVQIQAEEMGLDLDNLPDRKDSYDYHKEPIFKLMVKYGNRVEQATKDLEVVPIDANVKLLEKVLDVLSYSRHYVISKIGRALQSRKEEQFDLIMYDLADSKTSALFAYVAIQRNCQALLALVKHKPLTDWRENHLKLAKLSLKVSNLIKEEFFPLEDLIYEEFGYGDFNQTIYGHE
ncbi:hypothetical protein HYU95_01860 [Candidatus Daviesbacteria bacterium]|nr:hypothetical protein [Candidatus Daviesbacteria bacterium]